LAVAGEALADLLPDQQISVSLWRGEQLLLRIGKARVAHCDAFKAGINFLELDVESRNTLFSVVISALARSMD
ncbi:MAG: PilZ domain-containing protein, partial [Desulfocurvibacter africanus]